MWSRWVNMHWINWINHDCWGSLAPLEEMSWMIVSSSFIKGLDEHQAFAYHPWFVSEAAEGSRDRGAPIKTCGENWVQVRKGLGIAVVVTLCQAKMFELTFVFWTYQLSMGIMGQGAKRIFCKLLFDLWCWVTRMFVLRMLMMSTCSLMRSGWQMKRVTKSVSYLARTWQELRADSECSWQLML